MAATNIVPLKPLSAARSDVTGLRPDTGSENECIVELAAVSRQFGKGAAAVAALDAVDLQVRQGEFVAILGRSGSGKSTLLSLLAMLDQPCGGDYRFNGQPASRMPLDRQAALRNRSIGMVFQRFHLLADETAQKNVELPLMFAGVARNERRVLAARALEKLGLGDRKDHRPDQLSGGEQQRVAIARALINEPNLLLADEPTGALDTKTAQQIMGVLKELHANGQTIIMVTHDVNLARYADRAVILSDGRIVEEVWIAPKRRQLAHAEKPISEDNDRHRVISRLRSSLSGSGALGEQRRYRHKGRGRLSWLDAVISAGRVLAHNPVRSLLTTLGILVGIAAVIAMAAIGEGTRQQVSDQIAALGTDLLLVLPGSSERGGVRGGAGSRATLTEEDAQALRTGLPEAVVAPTMTGTAQVVHGNQNWSTLIGGVVPDYLAARTWRLRLGRAFSEREAKQAAKVALIGQTVAARLFGDRNPLDEVIRIGSTPFLVTGLLAPRGQNAASGRDQDDVVLIPLATAKLRTLGVSGADRRAVDFIVIKAADGNTGGAAAAASRILRDRHGLTADQVDDFVIRDPVAALTARKKSVESFTVMVLAIASVSLIVGGVGIMNIMLVSAAERRQEIALKLAVGARRRDIRNQFLTESAGLCLLGCLVGIGAGMAVAHGIALVTGWPTVTRYEIVIVAVTVAAAVGLFFGLYPATRAARMRDIVGALG